MDKQILDLIKQQRLSIVEVTTSVVVPEYLLDSPDDPQSYVDDSDDDIALEVREPSGKVICRGDQYDVIEFLKATAQMAGKRHDAE